MTKCSSKQKTSRLPECRAPVRSVCWGPFVCASWPKIPSATVSPAFHPRQYERWHPGHPLSACIASFRGNRRRPAKVTQRPRVLFNLQRVAFDRRLRPTPLCGPSPFDPPALATAGRVWLDTPRSYFGASLQQSRPSLRSSARAHAALRAKLISCRLLLIACCASLETKHRFSSHVRNLSWNDASFWALEMLPGSRNWFCFATNSLFLCLMANLVVRKSELSGISVGADYQFPSWRCFWWWSGCKSRNSCCWFKVWHSVQCRMLAIFVKPQQWPTPSESIAIYCVRKLVSCVTHLQSCAKVDACWIALIFTKLGGKTDFAPNALKFHALVRTLILSKQRFMHYMPPLKTMPFRNLLAAYSSGFGLTSQGWGAGGDLHEDHGGNQLLAVE